MSPELLRKLNGSAKTLGVASLGGMLGAAVPVVLWLMGIARAEGIEAKRMDVMEEGVKTIQEVHLPALRAEDKVLRDAIEMQKVGAATREANIANITAMLRRIEDKLDRHMEK